MKVVNCMSLVRVMVVFMCLHWHYCSKIHQDLN
ncbi:unnamed protein product [Trichobilharzia regenti]|nr:unnamed protein product [Trichobilharzia regenti]